MERSDRKFEVGRPVDWSKHGLQNPSAFDGDFLIRFPMDTGGYLEVTHTGNGGVRVRASGDAGRVVIEPNTDNQVTIRALGDGT